VDRQTKHMNTTELLAELNAATTNRQRNAALRKIAVAFFAALKVRDFNTSEILGEKLRNYCFDISPYAPR